MKSVVYALGLMAVLGLGGCGEPNSAARSTLPPGIGDVDVVVRLVHGTLANNAVRRVLAVHDDVYWRELLETGQDSATELQFIDGTRLTVGADAQVNLDEFVYGGPPGTDRMVMTVTKGMSRFVTGSMDKAAYEIRAPGAIIGVRGTEFTLLVDADAGTTLCLVHGGEVEFGRPDGTQRVIVRPGEASRASSIGGVGITPAAALPETVEAAKTTATLRAVVDAAREEQKSASRDDRSAAEMSRVARNAPIERRGDFGRARMMAFVQQLRMGGGGDSPQPTEDTVVLTGGGAPAPAPAKEVTAPPTAKDVAAVKTVTAPSEVAADKAEKQPEAALAAPKGPSDCGSAGCPKVPMPDLQASPIASQTKLGGG